MRPLPIRLRVVWALGNGHCPVPFKKGAGGRSRIFLGDLEAQFDYSQFMAPHEMGTSMIYHMMLKQSNCFYELSLPRRVGCSNSSQWGTGKIKLNNNILGFFSW